MPLRLRTSVPAACAIALLLLVDACKSAEEWRAEADREVYALVDARMAELASGQLELRVQPRPDSLRARLLAGESELVERPLGLSDLLSIASESSRDLASRKERVYLAGLAVTLERWRLGWQLEAGASASLSGENDEARTLSVSPSVALSRLLGTGADVLVGIGLSLTKNLVSGVAGGWVSTVDLLDVRQPLLRGFGPRIVEEPLTQAERNLVYEARAYERFRRQLAFDVASRLFRVLQQYDVIDNEESNAASLVALRERNEALARAGRLSEIEVGQALQNELRAKNRVIDARTQLGDLLDELKLFLGLPIELEIEIDRGELERLLDGLDAQVLSDPSAAASFALEHRLDVATARDQVADAGRKVYVAADALRMGLDLTGGAGLSQNEPGKVLEFDGLTWSLGASLDLPLNRLPERNVYRAALIDEVAARRAREASEDRVVADVRAELRAIAAALEDRRIQDNAVELALRRIESSTLNLQAGRATTRDLLEAQSSLLDSQNGLISARVEIALTRLELSFDLELLRFDEQGLHVVAPDSPEAQVPPAAPTLEEVHP